MNDFLQRSHSTGLYYISKKFKKSSDATEKMNGQHQIPLTDLLTSSFLKENTQFSNFEEFEDQEIFKTYSTFKDIPDNEMNEFVSRTTSFSSWSDMINAATKKYVAKKLGF